MPPHITDAGTHITGHRFCSDCWVEFLVHGLRRRSAIHAPLACPVCRANIAAPDVWSACFDLPPAWALAAPTAHKAAVLLPSVVGDRQGRGHGSSPRFATAIDRWAADATSSDDDALTAPAPAMHATSQSASSSSACRANGSSAASDECTPRRGSEEDTEGGSNTPVAAPLCRRAWDAGVGPGLRCLSGVLRAAREVAATTTREAMLEDSTFVAS